MTALKIGDQFKQVDSDEIIIVKEKMDAVDANGRKIFGFKDGEGVIHAYRQPYFDKQYVRVGK